MYGPAHWDNGRTTHWDNGRPARCATFLSLAGRFPLGQRASRPLRNISVTCRALPTGTTGVPPVAQHFRHQLGASHWDNGRPARCATFPLLAGRFPLGQRASRPLRNIFCHLPAAAHWDNGRPARCATFPLLAGRLPLGQRASRPLRNISVTSRPPPTGTTGVPPVAIATLPKKSRPACTSRDSLFRNFRSGR